MHLHDQAFFYSYNTAMHLHASSFHFLYQFLSMVQNHRAGLAMQAIMIANVIKGTTVANVIMRGIQMKIAADHFARKAIGG